MPLRNVEGKDSVRSVTGKRLMKESIDEGGNEWDEKDYQQHLRDLASKDASKPARLSIGRTLFQFIAGLI